MLFFNNNNNTKIYIIFCTINVFVLSIGHKFFDWGYYINGYSTLLKNWFFY